MPRRRFTYDEAMEIRRLGEHRPEGVDLQTYAQGVAQECGVVGRTIERIVAGKTYRQRDFSKRKPRPDIELHDDEEL